MADENAISPSVGGILHTRISLMHYMHPPSWLPMNNNILLNVGFLLLQMKCTRTDERKPTITVGNTAQKRFLEGGGESGSVLQHDSPWNSFFLSFVLSSVRTKTHSRGRDCACLYIHVYTCIYINVYTWGVFCGCFGHKTRPHVPILTRKKYRHKRQANCCV